jgi:glycosyltransferase involved in cell wall biosynthesis
MGGAKVKVTAIVPTYNRKPYIRRALESILQQSKAVDEVIVVDDGSTDGTAEAVREWFGDRVKVISKQNGGVAHARHTGIRVAQGDWIAFLDSDDEWMPDRNRMLCEAAAKVPEDVAWIFGDLQVVTDEGDGQTLYQEHGLELQCDLQIFGDSLTVQFPFQFGLLQGSFIRRKVLVELDCFSEGLRSDDDLLAGFQVACKYRVAAIPSVVGKYFRTSDLSASSVVVNGVYSPDHYRSRIMAFASVVKTGRRRPWNARYAAEVRGLCKVLAQRGKDVPLSLALSQFQFGAYSAKGIAFLGAALFGRRGVLAWESVAEARRRRMAQPS